MKLTILKWLIPSSVVKWLNGKKMILGLISFGLWAIIYGLPIVCSTEPCFAITSAGGLIQSFLLSLGLELDITLLGAGATLTLVGFIDKIVNHWFSLTLTKFFLKMEKPNNEKDDIPCQK